MRKFFNPFLGVEVSCFWGAFEVSGVAEKGFPAVMHRKSILEMSIFSGKQFSKAFIAFRGVFDKE